MQNKLRNITIANIKKINAITRNRAQIIFDDKLIDQDFLTLNVAITQKLRRNEIVDICNQKNVYEKNFSNKILIKIWEIQKSNEFCVKIRIQFKIDNTFARYNFEKNNIIQYYHAIYISRKITLKTKILRRCHDDSLTKHFDVKKTIILIQNFFFWNYMYKDIEKYIKKCNVY